MTTKIEEAIVRRARALHHALLTVDAHCDTPMLLRSRFNMGVRHDPGTLTGGQQDLVRMKEGGLVASFFAVFTPQGPLTEEGRSQALSAANKRLDAVMAMLRHHPDLCELALTAGDAARIHASGRRVIFLALENGYPLGLDLARVEAFWNHGIRYITLAHSKDNDLCDSATDRGLEGERPDTGLSLFGREVVTRMNELGIMVDISHLSHNSVADVLQVSTAPVLASHSAARALCDHPRNLTDAQLRAIQRNGGVVHVCLVANFLKQVPQDAKRNEAFDGFLERFGEHLRGTHPSEGHEGESALEKDWQAFLRDYPSPVVTVKDMVDHIDHIVKIIGIDHVGIGTDFDGGGGLTDCRDASELPRVTEELVRRGYGEAELRKIWGANVLRVIDSVQRQAGRHTLSAPSSWPG